MLSRICMTITLGKHLEMAKTGRSSPFLLYHCAYKCLFRAYRIVDSFSFSAAFSVTEIFCAHRSDSSFLGACGRTWSRSSASSRRRSAWERGPCAGRWHEQRITEAPREIQLCGLNKGPVLRQVVLCGGGDRVLGRWAGDRPLLRCCGNREIQETSICGAAAL